MSDRGSAARSTRQETDGGQRCLRHSSHVANPAGGSSMGSLPSSSPGVGTEAVVDHDVAAEFEGAQPDLDEPSFDHVLSRWRILVPVESLHPFVLRETKCSLIDLDAPSSGGDLISAKPKRRIRLGLCPMRNSPSGLPASTSQPQANSTAVNPLMTRRLDSRHGTSGADTAGRCRSPDACFSQRCHDRSTGR